MYLARSRELELVAGTLLALAVAASDSARAQPPPATELRAFRPEADAYVTSAVPEMNFGRSHALRADGAPVVRSYLKFRLEKVKGEITSVTLLLHAERGARASYEVRQVKNHSWGERAVTFWNAPRLSLRYASSKPVRSGAWSAVDVTSFVNGGSPHVSLAVTTRSPRGLVFESRETTHGPRLVVRSGTGGSKSEGARP